MTNDKRKKDGKKNYTKKLTCWHKNNIVQQKQNKILKFSHKDIICASEAGIFVRQEFCF